MILCDILEDMLKGDFEARAKDIVQRGRGDPDWMLDLLLSLSSKLGERTKLPKDHTDYLNPSSVATYFFPIKKLFDMNNVSVVWRRVYATFPEKDNVSDNRGWSREEIAAMLDHIRDPIDRTLVLILVSSGIRPGGLDLKWGDLTPIYDKDGRLSVDPGEEGEIACAAVNVYAGSPKAYAAFVTPEAYHSIVRYGRVWADTMMRQPGPDDPLFVTSNMSPSALTSNAIRARIYRMVKRAGLRDQSKKNTSRYQTQLMHGFRKYFNKMCRECLVGDSLATLIRAEYMMGHKGLTSLDQNYKTNMLEMAAEYVKVVPDLTINDAERLRQSNHIMSQNIQNLEDEKDAKIARLEKQIQDLEEKVGNPGVARADDIVYATVWSTKSGEVSGDVPASLYAIIEQLEKSQDHVIREMRAEYDTKIAALMTTIEKMSNHTR